MVYTEEAIGKIFLKLKEDKSLKKKSNPDPYLAFSSITFFVIIMGIYEWFRGR
jgi:hypothetical protein